MPVSVAQRLKAALLIVLRELAAVYGIPFGLKRDVSIRLPFVSQDLIQTLH